MAQYKVIADVALPDGQYAFAGSVIADDGTANSIPIPVGYSPTTGALDPITSDAITAVWNVGPQGQNDAEPNKWIYPFGWNRWQGVAYAKPVHYWRSVGGNLFVLNGAENLGARPGM